MRYRGDVPRPRIRFDDVPAEILETLLHVGGGHNEHGYTSEEIYEDDFDLLVTFSDDADYRNTRDLHVLAFGARSAHRQLPPGSGPRIGVISMNGLSRSRQVRVPATVRQEMSAWVALLDRSVVEQLPEKEKLHWTRRPASAVVLAEVGAEGAAHPVALLMRRNNVTGDGPYRLLLPAETTEHSAWLATFLRFLRETDTERFPTGPHWQTETKWAPPALSDALLQREKLEEERTALIAAIDAKAVEADAAVVRETAAAAGAAHRLLTSDGEDLVAAVNACLTDLGFVVRNMDAERPEGTPKLEDLRVTDPTRPDWTALVEIKGYSKGARANDVDQITARPAVQFAIEEHRAPDGLWHIVNAWRGTNPTGREAPLAGDTATLENLEQKGGVLIDTRDLFQAWKDAKTGVVTAETVRASLEGARRRWTHPDEQQPQRP